LSCDLCMEEGSVGVGLGYEISCVLSRECDVSAWVLLCWPGHPQFDRLKTKF